MQFFPFLVAPPLFHFICGAASVECIKSPTFHTVNKCIMKCTTTSYCWITTCIIYPTNLVHKYTIWDTASTNFIWALILFRKRHIQFRFSKRHTYLLKFCSWLSWSPITWTDLASSSTSFWCCALHKGWTFGRQNFPSVVMFTVWSLTTLKTQRDGFRTRSIFGSRLGGSRNQEPGTQEQLKESEVKIVHQRRTRGSTVITVLWGKNTILLGFFKCSLDDQ